jgi:hypothetical protein
MPPWVRKKPMVSHPRRGLQRRKERGNPIRMGCFPADAGSEDVLSNDRSLTPLDSVFSAACGFRRLLWVRGRFRGDVLPSPTVRCEGGRSFGSRVPGRQSGRIRDFGRWDVFDGGSSDPGRPHVFWAAAVSESQVGDGRGGSLYDGHLGCIRDWSSRAFYAWLQRDAHSSGVCGFHWYLRRDPAGPGRRPQLLGVCGFSNLRPVASGLPLLWANGLQ